MRVIFTTVAVEQADGAADAEPVGMIAGATDPPKIAMPARNALGLRIVHSFGSLGVRLRAHEDPAVASHTHY
jgi:hypothetical protein